MLAPYDRSINGLWSYIRVNLGSNPINDRMAWLRHVLAGDLNV